MKLTILGSHSSGNGYLLQAESAREALLIECGVPFKAIKRGCGWQLGQLVGCVLTHEHMDHASATREIMDCGVNLWASCGTLDALHITGHHRARVLHAGVTQTIGGFHIKPFDIIHDAAQPLGFLIYHSESGVILFLTDTAYSTYRFEGMRLSQILIEANYEEGLLEDRRLAGEEPRFLRDRVMESHMSLATAKGILQANDVSGVQNIVLIHLSDRNSDEIRFAREIVELTGKQVHVAREGLSIDFNRKPF